MDHRAKVACRVAYLSAIQAWEAWAVHMAQTSNQTSPPSMPLHPRTTLSTGTQEAWVCLRPPSLRQGWATCRRLRCTLPHRRWDHRQWCVWVPQARRRRACLTRPCTTSTSAPSVETEPLGSTMACTGSVPLLVVNTHYTVVHYSVPSRHFGSARWCAIAYTELKYSGSKKGFIWIWHTLDYNKPVETVLCHVLFHYNMHVVKAVYDCIVFYGFFFHNLYKFHNVAQLSREAVGQYRLS